MIKIAVTADDLLGVATPTADQLDAIVSAAVGRPAVVTRWNADPVPYESGSPATGTLAQPILVGHHSENRMRRHATRIHQAMDTAVAAAEQAADTQRRAQVAANGTDARYHPVTVANRIQRLTADRDRATRLLNGHTRTIGVLPNGTRITDTTTPATGTHRDRLTTRLAELTDQLTYWETIRDQQITTGATPGHSQATINPGDTVRIRGRWYQVIRVNKKTVTVPSTLGPWTDTAPYHEITDHQPAATTGDPETPSA